jgi:transcriptional regulator with XRE-family HTH domain
VFRVGDVVRKLRKDRGWTLDELAKQSKVSRTVLFQLEKGETDPRASTLRKIADAFGLSRLPEPSELAGGLEKDRHSVNNVRDQTVLDQTPPITDSRRSADSSAASTPSAVTSPVSPVAQDDVLTEEERQMLTPLEQSVIRRLRAASPIDQERIDQLIDVVTGEAKERAKGSTGTFDSQPRRFRS